MNHWHFKYIIKNSEKILTWNSGMYSNLSQYPVGQLFPWSQNPNLHRRWVLTNTGTAPVRITIIVFILYCSIKLIIHLDSFNKPLFNRSSYTGIFQNRTPVYISVPSDNYFILFFGGLENVLVSFSIHFKLIATIMASISQF